MTLTTQTQGDLVATLTTDETTRMRAPRGATPRIGSTVHLWRLRGLWSVWSDGPRAGAWWLLPVDDDARTTTGIATATPSRGAPVIVAVAPGAIAVASKDIRAGGA